MSNTEMNRQIVQEGLDLKKTARKQRMTDAAHDAQERQLRATINQHAQERGVERDAAKAKAQRQEKRQQQRAAAKAQENKDVARTIRLTAQIFGSLLLASLMAFGFILEEVSAGAALTAIGLAAIYCTATFIKYAARSNRARREA
jgi:cation transport ATPase